MAGLKMSGALVMDRYLETFFELSASHVNISQGNKVSSLEWYCSTLINDAQIRQHPFSLPF
jgi:hypothetical protein